MNKNFHNSRGSSTRTGYQNPRWRTVFIALALVIGSASLTPPVQAAAAGNFVEFELSVYPEKLPRICVGQKFSLYVGVSKTIFKVLNGKEFEIPGRAPNPVATGTKASGVGTLEKLGGGDLMSLTGENTFIFKSDKPGTATLRFTVPIEESWVGAKEVVIGPAVTLVKEITVKVGCKKKVTTIGQWSVPGPANIFIAATSDDATVEGDEQGSYKGSTTVNWIGSADQVGDCIGTITIGSSQVNWDGQMDESDQLTLNGTYQPAAGSIHQNCRGVQGDVALELIPDPLQVSLASSGGVYNQSQVLEGPEGPISGSVTIIVVPDEEEAAAFIPGDHQPGWDDFLSLFGALLALP